MRVMFIDLLSAKSTILTLSSFIGPKNLLLVTQKIKFHLQNPLAYFELMKILF